MEVSVHISKDPVKMCNIPAILQPHITKPIIDLLLMVSLGSTRGEGRQD
jgi:hypothetical protein